ncbi:hypothetical protein [Alcanivorax sp.]|uniref:hypothetical protein n=1 Tax=Alcanivorax sp. TaxID=1872427 RepID=UPI0025C2211E|nr:hypothetical protein [Alcanivorax sp.]
MLKKLPIVFLVLLSGGCSDDALIDIPELAGKSKSEVESLIGSPVSCGQSTLTKGEQCKFDKADTDIVFVDGKADWFLVDGMNHLEFSESTIELLGFEPQAPNFSLSVAMTWKPIQGLAYAALYKGGESADYALVKAFTE